MALTELMYLLIQLIPKKYNDITRFGNLEKVIDRYRRSKKE